MNYKPDSDLLSVHEQRLLLSKKSGISENRSTLQHRGGGHWLRHGDSEPHQRDGGDRHQDGHPTLTPNPHHPSLTHTTHKPSWL